MERGEIKPVEDKIKSDTEKQTNQFYEARQRDRASRSRKVKIQIEPGSSKSARKEIKISQAYYLKAEPEEADSGDILILFGLGLSLGLINDFSDLVTWQTASLVSQAIDIVALLLILFVLVFSSRTNFITVLIIILAFVLEILPVVGVVPWWTIGIILWYLASRNRQ